MLKTIPTISLNIQSLMTLQELDIINNTSIGKLSNVGSHYVNNIIIQNLGSNNIFIEFLQLATITGGIKIIPGDKIIIKNILLTDVYLISEINDNKNIRISFY